MNYLDGYPGAITNKAPSTRQQYIAAAKRFVTWLDGDELTQAKLDEYVEWLLDNSEGNGGRTKVLHIIPFIKYLNTQGLELRVPKVGKAEAPIPQTIDEETYLKIQNVTKPQHYKLAWALMYRLGLRIGEVLRLTWDDVNIEEGTLKIFRKGRKWQVIPYKLPEQNIDDLLTDLIENNERAGTHLITSGRTGKVVTKAAMHYAVKSACKRAGVEEIHVHTFRHGYALWAVKNKISAHVLQRLMGHSDVATTAKYLRTLDGDLDVMRDAYR